MDYHQPIGPPFRDSIDTTLISYSRGSEIPHLSYQAVHIILSTQDNDKETFWENFLKSLSIWNNLLYIRWSQQSFPAKPVELIRFVEDLQSTADEINPLCILVHHYHLIQQSEIINFLQVLRNHSHHYLLTILLFSKSSEKKPKLAVVDQFINNSRLVSIKELAQDFRKHNIELSATQLYSIYHISCGLLSVAQFFMEPLKQGGNKDKIIDQVGRTIFNYIDTFLFTDFSEQIKKAYLYLSLLERFSLDMAKELTQIDGAQLLLQVESTPVITYDHNSGLYSFSEIYLEFLRQKNISLTDETKQEFLLNAANWYINHEQTLLAIKCYIQADSPQKVWQALQSLDNLQFTREDAKAYKKVLKLLPKKMYEDIPSLQVINAYLDAALYQYDKAFKRMENLLANLSAAPQNDQITQALGEAHLVLALLKRTRLNGDCILHFKAARQYIPKGSKLIKDKAYFFGNTEVLTLKHPQAGSLYKELKTIKEYVPFATEVMNGCGYGMDDLAAAEYAYYTCREKEIDKHAFMAIQKALQKDQYDIVCNAYSLLIRYHLSKGHYADVMNYLDMVKQYADMNEYSQFFGASDVAVGWFYLRIGKPDDIAEWLKDDVLNRQLVMPVNSGWDKLIHAMYLLSGKRYYELISYLEEFMNIFYKRGQTFPWVYMLILKSLALHQVKDKEAAITAFELAYDWLMPNDIWMPFIEFGQYMRQMVDLCRKYSEHIPHEWLDKIYTKANTFNKYKLNVKKKYFEAFPVQDTPLTSLTYGERKVLYFLSTGMSRQEIGQSLGISLNTIKGMLKSIYIKIDASNRADAIRIAMSHHLIEDFEKK